MKKKAFLFSGQGAQYTGMGKDLCDNFKAAKNVYDSASEHFGYDVLKLSCEGTSDELAQTSVSQPLIYTLSMAAFAVLKENGITPDAVAGFSLGEVSALTAAEAINLETGFKVIKERAKAMQAAAENSSGTMFAVIGADSDVIEKACETASLSTGSYVIPVNYNCPGQIVIAGEETAAQAAAQSLTDSGLRVVRLAVNAAFHSKLMAPAAENFYNKISKYTFSKAKVTVYSNTTGDKVEISDIPSYLKKQMVSPVRFIDEMNAMSRDEIDTFVELGPGKTLCGFIRRGLKGSAAINVNIEDSKTAGKCLEKLLSENA